jgi:flagellar assembly protein FliH
MDSSVRAGDRSRSRQHHGVLFAEDFDAPPGVTVLDEAADEVEPPAPSFTEADLAAARAEAYAEGHRRGLAQAAADREEVTRQLLATIAERLQQAGGEAARAAETAAESVARLLLGVFAAVLPTLFARHGAAEVAALARAVLPALREEAAVTLEVSPLLAREVGHALEKLDAVTRAHTTLSVSEAVAPGDVRILWQDGAAVRDGAALWREVAEALAAFDLAVEPVAPVAAPA